ncbi:BtpA/SgcQ family protein [Halogeometricum borinquense]|uniref:BtpA/SgcQ family protein n=1 Tax=Halogeometricum borinquense TaxID=60847 RepID=A0A6C0UIM6_9EURY|nr:BtpA/SgcQ family protein [Halogeometricum borinquense]QIB74141.1 BtpA/SgcQ family protein [Halogeometricum borinquense]QIQ76652.1 BtpA/SgcQ family protein [Halogeometricum borinquense]
MSEATFTLPADAVVGMVHLHALPGAPNYDAEAGLDAVRESALEDAAKLDAGGVDAVMIENFGDAPFYPDDVPKHTVASMTAVIDAVAREVDVPVGVNVLRNDAEAALSIAAATGASFVRVNVHAGSRVTDQGVVEGRAHETMRLRDQLDADVAVFADVGVKHSEPLGPETPLDVAVEEVVGRGLADGVVVSGSGTGAPTDDSDLETVANAADEAGAPALVGSGVTAETVAETLEYADGVIVGTALKEGGETTAPVDESRVRAVVSAAHASQE